jgi:hypothetical protein
VTSSSRFRGPKLGRGTDILFAMDNARCLLRTQPMSVDGIGRKEDEIDKGAAPWQTLRASEGRSALPQLFAEGLLPVSALRFGETRSRANIGLEEFGNPRNQNSKICS